MEANGGDHAPPNGGHQAPPHMEAGGAVGGDELAEHALENGGGQAAPDMEAVAAMEAGGVVGGDVLANGGGQAPDVEAGGEAPAQAVGAANTPRGSLALIVYFLRSPAQEIARCRSVCRRWRSFTDWEPFRRCHSQHPYRTPMPLVYFEHPNLVHTNLRAIDIRDRVSRPVFRFNRPLDHEEFRIHGSCRGIMLLSSGGRLYACNPCTRRWAHVPPLHLGHDIIAFYVTGSYIDGDFACQVLYHDGVESDCNYSVHTLGMEAFLPMAHIGRPGVDDDEDELGLDLVLASGIRPSYKIPPVLVDTFLYWLPQAARNNSNIIRFNIYGEFFALIPPPTIQVDGEDIPVVGDQLFEIVEELAMTAISPATARVDVWVLSSITELWNRLYSIRLPVDVINLNDGYNQDGILTAGLFAVAQDRNDLVQCPRVLLQCHARGTVVQIYQLGYHRIILSRHTIEESLLLHPIILPMEVTDDAVAGYPPFLRYQ